MNPSVTLVKPYVGLSNTRATSVTQMYSVSPRLDTVEWRYFIGIPSTIPVTTYTVTNKTLNANLAILVDADSIIHLEGPAYVVIAPKGSYTFSFRFNESEAKNRSVTTTKNFLDSFHFTIAPFDYFGPVYINDGSNPSSAFTGAQDTTVSLPADLQARLNALGLSYNAFTG